MELASFKPFEKCISNEQLLQLLAQLKNGENIPVALLRKTKDERFMTQKGILHRIVDESGNISKIVEMTIDSKARL